MTMITGPITTGGSSRCSSRAPPSLTSALKAAYTTPAAASPHKVAGSPQVCVP